MSNEDVYGSEGQSFNTEGPIPGGVLSLWKEEKANRRTAVSAFSRRRLKTKPAVPGQG